MSIEEITRVLVVAHHTADEPVLLDAIRQRADQGPAQFVLLVPNPAQAEWHPLHPERRDKVIEAEQTLDRALPQLADAAGGPVRGMVSIRHDPMDAIEDAVRSDHFDEIIISAIAHRLSHRLHLDLAHRVQHLGIPVREVTSSEAENTPAG
jgi:hypothetical protein